MHNGTSLHRGVGSTVGDYDGDGWPDIFVTSFGDIGDIPGPGANRLYHNNGDGSFTEVAEYAGVAFDAQSSPDGFGACFGDYDLDGDLDLLVINNNGPVHLYRNNVHRNKHWLRIDVDTSANPALAPGGSGTRVTIKASGKKSVQVMDGGASYLGCSQMTTLFGLGSVRTVDTVTLEWADGFRTVLHDVDDNQTLKITAVLPLIQDENMHRGQNFDTTVRGLNSGEVAWFLASIAGTTPLGDHFPGFGDLAVNLRQPVLQLGSAITDANGEATLTAFMPPWVPLTQLATQVVISRGENGVGSIKTNVVLGQIQN
ncbi:MAG: FG-GAP-like repeat-containing protein [Planctomycetota bacterium]|nr:FG-GAP-like repeat-containing protein [Planctomycetota bacterium]MDA1114228.1 FG-GAP-like repeat-containing protein [Planctomycetota bacterium]